MFHADALGLFKNGTPQRTIMANADETTKPFSKAMTVSSPQNPT
jgi:hypothetical protein